jgi:hypothetical protein
VRLRAGLVFATFLMAAVSAYGDGLIVFDNFSCSNSVGFTGASGFNENLVPCAGSLGGEREDFLDVSGGSSNSVSTINSDPPSGAITGTFGDGINGFAGMVWGLIPTNNLNLDLVGDSILVQIQSDSGGTLNAAPCTSVTGNICNGGIYSVAFTGNSGYQDVFIPLTNPAVLGSGGGLADVNALDVYLNLNTPGSTWSIDAVEAESPEPSTLVLLTIGLVLGARLRQKENSK